MRSSPGFARDEIDAYEFYLAEKLGRTVTELRCTMSNAEYQQWRAYQTWSNAMADFAARKAQGRRQ